jgi:hypothetical protein
MDLRLKKRDQHEKKKKKCDVASDVRKNLDDHPSNVHILTTCVTMTEEKRQACCGARYQEQTKQTSEGKGIGLT